MKNLYLSVVSIGYIRIDNMALCLVVYNLSYNSETELQAIQIAAFVEVFNKGTNLKIKLP